MRDDCVVRDDSELQICVELEFVCVLGGGVMTTNGDFWGLMGTKNHGDSG